MSDLPNYRYSRGNTPADMDCAHHDHSEGNMPSDVVPPTQVDEATQQASTQPGDGTEVQATSPSKPSFKEQVIGYAQVGSASGFLLT